MHGKTIGITVRSRHLLGLLLLIAGGAQAQFLYTTNSGSITITGFTGTNSDVVIPAALGGLPVTRIGTNAFFEQGSITNLTLPDSVVSIDDQAFYGCTALASLTLGAGVTNLGVDAFGYCSSLANVTFPAGLVSLGSFAFEQCTALAGAEFEGNAPNSDATVFSGDGSASAYYLPGSANWGTSLGGISTAPAYLVATNSGTITVSGGNSGFVGSLAFPATLFGLPLTGIAGGAFEDNSGLTGVTIPASVTNIGAQAFAICTALTSLSVSVGNPAYSSAAGVLFDRAQRTLLQYPLGSGASSYAIPNTVTNIGASAFRYATGLVSIAFPTSVAVIGDDAFDNCSGVTSLSLPSGLTAIGASVFSDCYSLTNLTLPSSLLTIGQGAFGQCLKLGSVAIPDSVTNIEAGAFQECQRLVNVSIGNGVTAIGDFAFYSSSLTNVTLGTSLRTIGNSAFDNCLLASLILPASVESIGDSAFENCQLDRLTLPNSVTNVGTYAFDNCSLTNLVIGSGLSAIPDSAFASCYNLAIVDFEGNPPNVADSAFAGDAATAFFVPGSGNWPSVIGGLPTQPAFFWATNFGAITITAGNTNFGGPLSVPRAIFGQPVVSVADFAFAGTLLLSSMGLPDSVTSLGIAPFLNCPGLGEIEVAADNPNYSSLGGALFNKNQTSLIEYPAENGQASYTVPSTVANIEVYAFAGAGLERVILPGSVLSIGQYAFSGCSGLTNVAFANGLTSLGAFAFAGCGGLTSITLPPSLTAIGVAPFVFCSSLTAINVAPGNPAYASVNGVLFDRGQGVLIEYPPAAAATSYVVPAAVTNLGEYAFADAGSLNSILFQTNAPGADSTVFTNDTATVFYVPGTTGWSTNFEGLAAGVWTLEITSQPLSQSAFPGTNVTLSVSATGPPAPLAYTWFFDGAAVRGATDSGLTLVNVQAPNSGTYQVVITNVYGAITSVPASLTVTDFFVLPLTQFQISGPTNLLSLEGFVDGATAGTRYSWSKISGLEQVTFDDPAVPSNSPSPLSSGLDQLVFTDPVSSASSVVLGFAGAYRLALTATTGTNVSTVQATVTASVNPNGTFTNISELVSGPMLTNGSAFLSYTPFTNNAADAAAYYAAIDPSGAKSTLTKWKVANGIPTSQIPPASTNFMNGVVAATYLNCLDLGFARRMIMSSNSGNWAFAVSNYRTLADALNDTGKIATVTMDYSPVAPGGTQRFTKFYVYDSKDQLIPAADLDGGGAKFVPGLCEVCHGGTGGPVTAGVTNVHAHFLGFDVRALDYAASSNFNQAALEPELRLLNQGVLQIEQDIALADSANFSAAIPELIQGWYGAGLTNAVQNADYVPSGWQDRAATNTLTLAGQAYLYQHVVAPSCRSCHETRAMVRNLDFRSFTNFNAFASGGVNSIMKLCLFGTNTLSARIGMNLASLISTLTMPQARRTFQRFWNSLNPRPESEILANYFQGTLDFYVNHVYTPPPPLIIGLQPLGTDVLIDFISHEGSYSVQAASDLEQPAWQPLPGTLSGNGSVVRVVEPMGSSQPGGFYRVLAQP